MESLYKHGGTRGPALRPAQQARYIAVGRSTLYVLEKQDPTFPPKHRLTPGGRATMRFQADLDDWMLSRAKPAGAAQSDANNRPSSDDAHGDKS